MGPAYDGGLPLFMPAEPSWPAEPVPAAPSGPEAVICRKRKLPQDASAPTPLASAGPFADPQAAAAKLLEIAADQRVDKGRRCIGEWNWRFLRAGGSVTEYSRGRDWLITNGQITMDRCGGFFTMPDGARAFPK